MKRRKNPYGIPLIPIAIGLGIGLLGWGAGAVYLELDAQSYLPNTKKAYDHAVSLLMALEQGKKDEWFTNNADIPSVIVTPTTVNMAKAQIAYWSARAAARTQDPVYVQIAQTYLTEVASRDSDIDQDVAQTLLDGVNKLNATARAGDIQDFVYRLSSKADPALIAEERNTSAQHTPKGTDLLYQNLQDSMAPFSVVAGLWTGKKPSFMDDSTWRYIQVGVYGTLGLGTLAFLMSYKSQLANLFGGSDEKE